MTNQPMDNSNWREDYKGYKHLNKKQRDLLENGPKSLSQSWILGALYQKWKRIKGIPPDPEPPDCQSSMNEFFKKQDTYGDP